MTSLGRLIFFDQPGTGASDPVTPGALPTLEQWADSITAVLDDLGSREAVLVAIDGAFATGALFAATHPSRTTALVVLDGYADTGGSRLDQDEAHRCDGPHVGQREVPTSLNPDMPWNEEIRATWARMERLAASPRDRCAHDASRGAKSTCGRCFRPSACRPSSSSTADDPLIVPAMGKYVAEHIPDAKYVELPGRNCTTSSNRGDRPFRRSHEFLTGDQPDVADDRVLATVLFTDIVDSTRRAAEIGDRDWHALLDAHDAVVRVQLNRFRGREVNTSGDGFLAMFDGPQRAIRCAMSIRDAVQALGIEVRAGLHTGECEIRGDDIGGIARAHRRAGERIRRGERRAGIQHAARPRDRFRARVRRPRRSSSSRACPASGISSRWRPLRRKPYLQAVRITEFYTRAAIVRFPQPSCRNGATPGARPGAVPVELVASFRHLGRRLREIAGVERWLRVVLDHQLAGT